MPTTYWLIGLICLISISAFSNRTLYCSGATSTGSCAKALGTEIKISQLDADGTAPIETWIIKNPLITKADFDSLDYGQEDLLNITISITYDYAILENLGQGRDDLSGATLWSFNSQEGSGFNPEG